MRIKVFALSVEGPVVLHHISVGVGDVESAAKKAKRK
jgi:hypothetical protein